VNTKDYVGETAAGAHFAFKRLFCARATTATKQQQQQQQVPLDTD